MTEKDFSTKEWNSPKAHSRSNFSTTRYVWVYIYNVHTIIHNVHHWIFSSTRWLSSFMSSNFSFVACTRVRFQFNRYESGNSWFSGLYVWYTFMKLSYGFIQCQTIWTFCIHAPVYHPVALIFVTFFFLFFLVCVCILISDINGYGTNTCGCIVHITTLNHSQTY